MLKVRTNYESDHTGIFNAYCVPLILSHLVLEPNSANAVWIHYREMFHICWNASSYNMQFDNLTYRIMDNYHELHGTVSPSTSTYALDLEATSNISDSSSITIQTLSNSALPSLPESVTISG